MVHNNSSSLLLICGVMFMALVSSVPTAGKKDLSVSAINYMAAFGYYNQPNYKLGQVANEEDIRNSIKSMQRFAGIPVTGSIDEKTEELMKTPRCGLEDVSPHSDTRKRRFTLQGSLWKKEDLTWRLANDNNDGLTRQEVERVLQKAFNKWHKITNLNFRKLSSGSVDIEVKFVTNYHKDPYPFDGPGGTLAHAFYPHNNQGLSGDVHFDDDEVFTIGKSHGRSLLWVAVHEIGHSIGLRHSDVKEAVMYPWYRGNGGRDFQLHYDDQIGAQTLYGSRSVHPENPDKKTQTPTTMDPSNPTTKRIITSTTGCTDTFKAVFLDKATQKTYVINNDKVYVLTASKLNIEKGPIHISKLFPRVQKVDAAYEKENGDIVLFSDDKYFTYNGVNKGRLIDSGIIYNKYNGLDRSIKQIDAAFIWPGNGRTYLFVGENYYRYNERTGKIDAGYPRAIAGAWNGIPANIDAVFVWRNKATYFFKGTQYYRFNNIKIRVEADYPRSISPIWTSCEVDTLQAEGGKSSAISYPSSLFISSVLVIIAKMFN